jgi:hypothetical protein
MPATVVFERTAHKRYLARPIHLIIDGVTVAMLSRGRRIDIEVTTGLHDAVGEMDGYQSDPLRFRIADGEVVYIRCWPNPKAGFTVPWWTVLSRRMQEKFQRFVDPSGKGLVLLEQFYPDDGRSEYEDSDDGRSEDSGS